MRRFHKAVLGFFLSTMLLANGARAGEFVSAVPEPRDEKTLASSFSAGYRVAATVVGGLQVAITDKGAYPIQLKTQKDGLIVQAEAQVDQTTRRFNLRLLGVVADGKVYPLQGYVTDGARGENLYGLKGDFDWTRATNPESVLTLPAGIQCVLVVTESVAGLAQK